jgi:hypothetical protein
MTRASKQPIVADSVRIVTRISRPPPLQPHPSDRLSKSGSPATSAPFASCTSSLARLQYLAVWVCCSMTQGRFRNGWPASCLDSGSAVSFRPWGLATLNIDAPFAADRSGTRIAGRWRAAGNRHGEHERRQRELVTDPSSPCNRKTQRSWDYHRRFLQEAGRRFNQCSPHDRTP